MNRHVDIAIAVGLFACRFDVTDTEFKKMNRLNKSLDKIMQRLQYLFILAVSRLQLIGTGTHMKKNNNNNRSVYSTNDKNIQVFCDNQIGDAFREHIVTVKVLNHLIKRHTNMKNKSRIILTSNVEFIHMSEYMRLYFDDKNIMCVDESDD